VRAVQGVEARSRSVSARDSALRSQLVRDAAARHRLAALYLGAPGSLPANGDGASGRDRGVECGICRMPAAEGVMAACSHVFCLRCIEGAVDAQRTSEAACPVCFQNLSFDATRAEGAC